LITIRKDDLRQLAIDNPRDTNLNQDKTAKLLSENVT